MEKGRKGKQRKNIYILEGEKKKKKKKKKKSWER